jgi:DNA polymerase III gamma/tau subunit
MCKLAESGRLLDLIEIDAASNRGINEIRDLKEKIAFSPVQGKYKIYIIDEVHMLTKEAFNALLKTLEEPPAHTVLILATTEVHKLPQTILSRVVRFDFRLGSKENLSEKLSMIVAAEGRKIEPEALERLVRLGKGSYRDAESLLEKLLKSAEGEEITLEELAAVLGLVADDELGELLAAVLKGGNAAELLAILARIESRGVSPQQLLLDIAEHVLATIESEGSGNYSLRDLLKVSGAVQLLIAEMNYYPDPYVAIKLRLLDVAQPRQVVVEQAVAPVQPLRMPVQANKQSISPPVIQNVVTESTTSQVTSISEVTKAVVETSQVAASPIVPAVTTGSTITKGSTSTGQDITQLLVGQVKAKDPRIAAMLSQGRVLQNAGLVEIQLPYKFHLDRLGQIKSKQVILSALSALGINGVELGFSLSQNIQARSTISSPVNTTGQQLPDSSNEKLVEEIFSDII